MGTFQKKNLVGRNFKQNMSFKISEMNSNNKNNNPMIDKVWMGTDHWIHPFPPWMPPEENPMDNDDLSSEIRISSFIPQIPPTAWLNNGKNLTSNSNRSALQDCNPRFKTEICRNFKERNKCIYGDRCQFAHGRQELRDVVRNSKYKTKRCQKYWIAGYCAYGPRCNFLHYEEKDQVQPKHAARNRDPSASGGESGYTSVSPPSMSPPNIKYKLPSTPVPL